MQQDGPGGARGSRVLLAHALVRVDVGLAVGTCVCHVLEVVEQAGDQAAAEITPGAQGEAERLSWAVPGHGRHSGPWARDVSRSCHPRNLCSSCATSVPRSPPCPMAQPQPPALGPPRTRLSTQQEAPALPAAPTPRSSRRSQEGSS